MAATQVGLVSQQAALGISVTASQWILNLTLMIVAGLVTVGGAQGRMMMISMTITAFAPTVIGLIIQAVDWPFAYLLTVAAAVIAFFLLRKVRYEQKTPAATPFDYTGSVLVFLAVALLITGIMQAGTTGLSSPTVFLMVGAGLLVGLVLVLTSQRKQHPLIQFRVMKIRSVAIAVFVSLMRFLPSVLMGAFVARYVQQS